MASSYTDAFETELKSRLLSAWGLNPDNGRQLIVLILGHCERHEKE